MMFRTILSAIFAVGLIAAPHISFAETAEHSQDDLALASLPTVSADSLSEVSGGMAIVGSSADIKSSVDGNYIDTIGKTGEIANNSLSNNSGFTTLIANSGNQVSISQATAITIYVH